MTRILVTGSRNWRQKRLLEEELEQAWRDLGSDPYCVLVHGACHVGGADLIAERYWRAQMRPYEGHPARRVNGKVYGPERNQHMVDLGADLCLAFPHPDSRGTRDCMQRAEAACIPVRIIEGGTDS